MGTSVNTANNILNLIMSGTLWTGVAANAQTATITTFYIALHTGDPGPTGNQATNEVTYLGYARATTSRAGGWTAAASASTHPAGLIDFPLGTGGANTATHFSVGLGSTGATEILWFGTVTPNIPCGTSVQPQLTTATVISLA